MEKSHSKLSLYTQNNYSDFLFASVIIEAIVSRWNRDP